MTYAAQVSAIERRKTCQNTFSADPQDQSVTLDCEAGADTYAGELMHRYRHKTKDDMHNARKRPIPFSPLSFCPAVGDAACNAHLFFSLLFPFVSLARAMSWADVISHQA